MAFDYSLLAASVARDAGTLSSYAATDDNDLDLLNNLEDYENMGNPFLDDTDDDGLLDGDEFYADGTHGDTDGYSTGVNNTDTDNDGMGDGWEVTYGFNPTSANAPSTDSDGDGLTDEQEFSSNGNPFSADTDNNGMSDALEYRYEMNLSTHVDSDTCLLYTSPSPRD